MSKPGTALVSWDASVARARAAMLKSFEGCMEAAAASAEQIPHDPEHKTERDLDGRLARFASEADIGYGTLVQYRNVQAWLGEEYAPQCVLIPTFTLARTAKQLAVRVGGKRVPRFPTGADFAAFLAETEPPVLPNTLKPGVWTRDALLDHFGRTLNARGPSGGGRALPRNGDEVAYIVTGLVKKDAKLATYALALLDEKLYGIGPEAARPVALVGKRADAARRADSLMRKAFSTPEEPEAVAFFLGARKIAANYDLTVNPNTGEH